jgi:hypothetical protein
VKERLERVSHETTKTQITMTRPRKPPPDPREVLLAPVKRWDNARKANLCRGIILRQVTREEVKAAHAMSDVELDALMRDYGRGGETALRLTSPGLRRAGRAG